MTHFFSTNIRHLNMFMLLLYAVILDIWVAEGCFLSPLIFPSSHIIHLLIVYILTKRHSYVARCLYIFASICTHPSISRIRTHPPSICPGCNKKKNPALLKEKKTSFDCFLCCRFFCCFFFFLMFCFCKEHNGITNTFLSWQNDLPYHA